MYNMDRFFCIDLSIIFYRRVMGKKGEGGLRGEVTMEGVVESCGEKAR
jgi:hypothetical protein